MESDDFNLHNLREWQPVNDVLQKIPPKVQRGFFYQELNVTCIDVLPEYLGLGSDVGIIFWYNRRNGNVQKLRTESTAPITCIKLISSVEYMVAAGNAHGEVTVFQIQKELPTELITDKLAAEFIQSKPIERYTIRDACRGQITCLEWSKNGMKLFSGDSHGIVVLTEFDFTQHISKSIEVINEKFAIVQMQFSSPWLLISTLYRAIVCRKNDQQNEHQWNVSQIGRTDRKILNNFGVVFTPTDSNHRKSPSIICARSGFRFWLADIEGNVSHTFLLKDSIADAGCAIEVPLLNPVQQKVINIKDAYFGPCHYFMDKFIVTYCDTMVFIIDVEKLNVMATVRRLRKIQYLSVHGNEIFIVEGGRSIVRIATAPEQDHHKQQQHQQHLVNGSTQYAPLNNNNNLMLNEADIEIQGETIAQADECFELPPIEQISLDIPLTCRSPVGEHNLLNEDKLLLEHSRKLKVFEKINRLDYDDSILFQAGTKKKKKMPVHILSTATAVIDDVVKIDGVVEIGRHAELLNPEHNTNDIKSSSTSPSPSSTSSVKSISDNGLFNELTIKPCLMLASYCDGVSNIQETPILNIGNTISTNSIDYTQMQLNHKSSSASEKSSHPKMAIATFELSYPIYPIAGCVPNENGKTIKINGSTHVDVKATAPIQSQFNDISLTSDEDDDAIDSVNSMNAIKQCANNHTPTKLMSSELASSIPSLIADHHDQAKYFPSLSNLPKLWDMKIEKCDDSQYNAQTVVHNANTRMTNEGIENEWVFL